MTQPITLTMAGAMWYLVVVAGGGATWCVVVAQCGGRKEMW